MSRLLARRERDESGVIAIIVALLSVVLLMSAAFAVDLAMQVNRRHQLNDTLDAAAQSGAYELPTSTAAARTNALRFAEAHDPTETGDLAPDTDFWCIVASTPDGAAFMVDTTQVPATCNPGTGPYPVGVNYQSTGRKVACSKVLCAIPCVEPTPNTGTPKIACNTIRVFQGRDVPFAFGPAGGIPQGSTGDLVSVACKGSCGTVAPNPMDVAVIADRTRSMSTTDVADMVDGIRGMLREMTPDQQYVSLGAIGRSAPTSASQSGSCGGGGLTYPSSSGSTGRWLPVSFSDDYVDGARNLQEPSALVKGVECVKQQSDPAQGTSLAAPMKAAARYLLGWDANNLASLPQRDTPPTKVLVFETDGQPNETQPTGGTTSLNSAGDVFSNRNDTAPPVTTTQPDTTTISNGVTTVTHHQTITHTYTGGAQACNNLVDVAQEAKAQGILVVMIAYNLTGKKCNDYDGGSPTSNGSSSTQTTAGPEPDEKNAAGQVVKRYRTETTTVKTKSATTSSVLDVMATAASPANGLPSAADSDCSTDALRAAENSDGDYLFCGATGTDMAPIFTAALSQASNGIKLLRMPSS
jgi:hypothetical protein